MNDEKQANKTEGNSSEVNKPKKPKKPKNRFVREGVMPFKLDRTKQKE